MTVIKTLPYVSSGLWILTTQTGYNTHTLLYKRVRGLAVKGHGLLGYVCVCLGLSLCTRDCECVCLQLTRQTAAGVSIWGREFGETDIL